MGADLRSKTDMGGSRAYPASKTASVRKRRAATRGPRASARVGPVVVVVQAPPERFWRTVFGLVLGALLGALLIDTFKAHDLWPLERNQVTAAPVCLSMARPPQYSNPEESPPTFAQVKAIAKRLSPKDRATLLAWLALYYDDRGELFPPAQSKRRDKATLSGQDYWLVGVPKKP